MTTSPEDFDEPLQLGGEKKSYDSREDASIKEEKIESSEFSEVVGASTEPELEPMMTRIDGAEIEKFDIKESKDEMNEDSEMVSNSEKIDDQSHCGSYGDRNGLGVESSTASAEARIVDGGNDDTVESQQRIREDSENGGEQFEDGEDRSEAENITANTQITSAKEGEEISDGSALKAQTNELVPTECLDLEAITFMREDKDQSQQKSSVQGDNQGNILHSREYSTKQENTDSSIQDVPPSDDEKILMEKKIDNNEEVRDCVGDDDQINRDNSLPKKPYELDFVDEESEEVDDGVDGNVNVTDTNNSNSTSSGKRDNKDFEKPLDQSSQDAFDTESYLKDQKDQETRVKFGTDGEEEEAPEKLPQEETDILQTVLSEPLSPMIRLDKLVNDNADSTREMATDHISSSDLEVSSASGSKVEKLIDNSRQEVTHDDHQPEISNDDNKIDMSGIGQPAEDTNLMQKNPVNEEISLNTSKPVDRVKVQHFGEGGEAKASNDNRSEPKNFSDWNKSDSTSRRQSPLVHFDPDHNVVVESLPKPSQPVNSSVNPDKVAADIQLEDLEALLQYNPPSVTDIDDQNPEVDRLENLLLDSKQSRTPSNTLVDDNISKELKEVQFSNYESTLPEKIVPNTNGTTDLSQGVHPNLFSDHDVPVSNLTTRPMGSLVDDTISNELKEVQFSNFEPTLPEKIVPNTNDTANFSEGAHISVPPNLFRDHNVPVSNLTTRPMGTLVDENISNELKEIQFSNFEPTLSKQIVSNTNGTTNPSQGAHISIPPNLFSDHDVPVSNLRTGSMNHSRFTGEQSTGIVNQDMKDDNKDGQSVFSNSSTGQNYLRLVSNAKEQLGKIEDEMNALRGLNNNGEIGNLNNNSNFRGNSEVVPPFEMSQSSENAGSPISRKKKPTKQSIRGMEPPTQYQRNTSGHKPRKEARKVSKKAQIRPERGKRKDSRDPVGNDVPREKYNHGDRKRNTSSGKRRTKRDMPSAPKNVKGKEQNRNRDDPPMVVRNLEVDSSPSYPSGDHLSIEKRTKRKKRRENNRTRDGSESRYRSDELSSYNERHRDGTEMNGIVSSYMDRGDEGWNRVNDDDVIIEEEIDGVPREVDAKESKHQKQDYDPWEDIPCSFCCRYLPHTLVVATTHAYRLDRADQKEQQLMESKQ